MFGFTAKRAYPLVVALAIGLSMSACARHSADEDALNAGANAGMAASGPGSSVEKSRTSKPVSGCIFLSE